MRERKEERGSERENEREREREGGREREEESKRGRRVRIRAKKVKEIDLLELIKRRRRIKIKGNKKCKISKRANLRKEMGKIRELVEGE